MSVHAIQHPLVQPNLGLMREAGISTKSFRQLAGEMDERLATVIDPMLATGGTMVATLDMLKERGCQQMKVIVLVAAPEGIKRVQENYPDIEIYTSAIDDHLDRNGYIVPGLGDAGDKIFGTR